MAEFDGDNEYEEGLRAIVRSFSKALDKHLESDSRKSVFAWLMGRGIPKDPHEVWQLLYAAMLEGLAAAVYGGYATLSESAVKTPEEQAEAEEKAAQQKRERDVEEALWKSIMRPEGAGAQPEEAPSLLSSNIGQYL